MRKIISVFMGICLGILLSVNTAQAATPRVMLSDYSIEEGKAIAGKEFTLTLTLKNTAQRAVKNIKLTLSTENGELLPVEGAGTAYAEQIDADSEETFSFKMETADNVEEKAYKLSVKTEYENTGGWEYTVEDTVFIPISMEQRASITNIFTVNSVELGDIVEISAVVNNLGGGNLYNVKAGVKGDNLDETDTYVGNVEPGKSGMIDILTKASAVTGGDTRYNKILISYEDRKGNVYEEEKNLLIEVTKPHYENMEKVKEGRSGMDILKLVLKGIAGVLAIAVILFLLIRRKKHKQELLEEFMK